MLCRAVGADIGIALQPGGRGHRDHAAVTPLAHPRQYGLDGVHHAHEIDVHHPPEQIGIGLAEWCGLGAAGIGDQDVDRLPRCRCRDGGTDGLLIPDIGHGGKVRGTFRHGFIQGGAIAAHDRDGRAGLRKLRCDLQPNAPAATGDERMGGTRQSGHSPYLRMNVNPAPDIF